MHLCGSGGLHSPSFPTETTSDGFTTLSMGLVHATHWVHLASVDFRIIPILRYTTRGEGGQCPYQCSSYIHNMENS